MRESHSELSLLRRPLQALVTEKDKSLWLCCISRSFHGISGFCMRVCVSCVMDVRSVMAVFHLEVLITRNVMC